MSATHITLCVVSTGTDRFLKSLELFKFFHCRQGVVAEWLRRVCVGYTIVVQNSFSVIRTSNFSLLTFSTSPTKYVVSYYRRIVCLVDASQT